MAASDTFCSICRESVSFPGKDVACVGRKGFETINAFSLKHNDLNLENPIYEYNENRKRRTCTRVVAKSTPMRGDMSK